MQGVGRRSDGTATQSERLAVDAHRLLVAGHEEAARAAYDELVGLLQRRASRVALYYLRNAADADEAVQDAFVKAYLHLRSYREQMPFEAWFTRILVNGCLDRLKGLRRRSRWLTWAEPVSQGRWEPVAADRSPEDDLVLRDNQRLLGDAIERLPDRQRTVVLLTHFDGRTPREIGLITGMNETTVRVHLFRAIRRLRGWLTEPASAADTREAGA